LSALSQLAAPIALLVLGMGLAEYGVRAGCRQSFDRRNGLSCYSGYLSAA